MEGNTQKAEDPEPIKPNCGIIEVKLFCCLGEVVEQGWDGESSKNMVSSDIEAFGSET